MRRRYVVESTWENTWSGKELVWWVVDSRGWVDVAQRITTRAYARVIAAALNAAEAGRTVRPKRAVQQAEPAMSRPTAGESA